jgi:hypothetical protein
VGIATGMSSGEFVIWHCALFVAMRKNEPHKRGKGKVRGQGCLWWSVMCPWWVGSQRGKNKATARCCVGVGGRQVTFRTGAFRTDAGGTSYVIFCCCMSAYSQIALYEIISRTHDYPVYAFPACTGTVTSSGTGGSRGFPFRKQLTHWWNCIQPTILIIFTQSHRLLRS